MISSRTLRFVIEFMAFCVLSALAFSLNSERLFFGMDGLGLKSSISFMSNARELVLGLVGNPLQGLGSLYTLNVKLIPSFIFFDQLGPVAAYVLVAIELFGATYFLGTVIGMSETAKRLSGYAICLFSLPYFDKWQIYPVFNLAPNIAECIATSIFSSACVGYSFQVRGIRRLFAFIGGIGCVLWLVLSQPTYLLILTPTLCLLFVSLWLANRHRSYANVVALIWILMAIIAVIFVWNYIVGVFLFTASSFFTSEFNTESTPTAYAVSIAFQGAVHGNAGPVLFGLTTLGFFRFILFRPKGMPHWSFALPLFPLGIYALAYLFHDDGWPYPLPIYFEFSLWPLYALTASTLIDSLTAYMPFGRTDEASPTKLKIGLLPRSPKEVIFAVLCLAVTFQPRTPTGDILGRYPARTPISEKMQSMIGISERRTFQGYSANFRHPPPDQGDVSWGDLVTLDLMTAKESGNSHRMMGLWTFAIPTFEDYQPITNPYLYALASRLLSPSEAKQTRNILLLTQPRLNILKALGVRLILSTTPVDGTKLLHSSHFDEGSDVVLLELENANLGDYSPTRIKTTKDANDAINAMKDPNLDFRRTAITFERIETQLVPMTSSEFLIGPDGYTLRANTAGTSLIVIPVQFSNCLSVRGDLPQGTKLLRTNLILTGIVFSGSLDVTIRKEINLFANADCRKWDYVEAQSLGLKNIGF